MNSLINCIVAKCLPVGARASARFNVASPEPHGILWPRHWVRVVKRRERRAPLRALAGMAEYGAFPTRRHRG